MARDLPNELSALQLAVDRLTQGLQLMQETLETQTELLLKLTQAAAGPDRERQSAAQAIAQLTAAVGENTQTLAAVERDLQGLPEAVGRSVADSLQAALSSAP